MENEKLTITKERTVYLSNIAAAAAAGLSVCSREIRQFPCCDH